MSPRATWRSHARAVPGRDAIETARPPGGAVIRALALLVAPEARDAWALEWRAELLHGFDGRLARGARPSRARLALRLRACAAVTDALWMRRHYRQRGALMLGPDLRLAARALARQRGFSALLTLTMALGIGITTAIFSVVDGLVLRPPPYADVARLAEVWNLDRKENQHYPGLHPDVARAWETQHTLFEEVATYRDGNVLARRPDEPVEVRAAFVSATLLPMLGVRPRLGRLFAPDEMRADGPPVTILSEAFWREAMGGEGNAIGRTIPIDGVPHTIIGVMPRAFKFPLGTVSLWLPMRPAPASERNPRVNFVVRIRRDVTREAVTARVDALGLQLERDFPRERGWSVRLQFLDEHLLVGHDTERALWLLLGAVACVLLIACANAANLLLVRGTVRLRELAIRRALGASRGRLIRQLLSESVILAAISGVLGTLLAYGGIRAILGIMPQELIRFSQGDIAVNGRVLGFALAISLLTGLLFGVGPALRASRARASLALADRTGSGTPSAQRMRSALVVVELALSMVLLVGAGLFTRSFGRLAAVDPGFDIERIVEAYFPLAASRYPTPAARETFARRLEEAALRLPGVERIAHSSGLSFSFDHTIEAEGRAEPFKLGQQVLPYRTVDTEYFATLGIPILRGRAFTPDDRPGGPKVVILDPELATALWPDAHPIGRRMRINEPGREWLTVVGVAGDVKSMGLDDRLSRYGMYYAASQRALGRYRVISLRTTGDPAALIGAFKRRLWEINPDQPVYDVRTGLEIYGESLVRPRFLLTLMSVFAGVALVMAAVGIYGVISYAVTQRTREIGIRLAIGARQVDILRTVVGRGLVLAVIGAASGTALALFVTRPIAKLLFGVSPTDLVTMTATAGMLIAVALIAVLVPARRASEISPLAALRAE